MKILHVRKINIFPILVSSYTTLICLDMGNISLQNYQVFSCLIYLLLNDFIFTKWGFNLAITSFTDSISLHRLHTEFYVAILVAIIVILHPGPLGSLYAAYLPVLLISFTFLLSKWLILLVYTINVYWNFSTESSNAFCTLFSKFTMSHHIVSFNT